MKLIEIDGKYINPEHVAVVQPGPFWDGRPADSTAVIMVSGYTIDVRRPPEVVVSRLGLA